MPTPVNVPASKPGGWHTVQAVVPGQKLVESDDAGVVVAVQ